MFVVGIYSGSDKLGEGFGHSLKVAEYRVRQCFRCLSFFSEVDLGRGRLLEPSLPDPRLPPSAFPPSFTPSETLGSFEELLKADFVVPCHPPVLGESEVLYASRGWYEKPSVAPTAKLREGGDQEVDREEVDVKSMTP